jgi:WD40 repeat protein
METFPPWKFLPSFHRIKINMIWYILYRSQNRRIISEYQIQKVTFHNTICSVKFFSCFFIDLIVTFHNTICSAILCSEMLTATHDVILFIYTSYFELQIWSLGSPDPNFTLDGHQKGVNCVDYFTGGDRPYLITGSDDSTAKVQFCTQLYVLSVWLFYPVLRWCALWQNRSGITRRRAVFRHLKGIHIIFLLFVSILSSL